MVRDSPPLMWNNALVVWALLAANNWGVGGTLAFVSKSDIPWLSTRKRIRFRSPQMLASSVRRQEERDSWLDIDDDDPESFSSSALRSVTFRNLPKDGEPDVLCDFLMELGACSASITDADAGTPDESPIFGEPSDASPWEQESKQVGVWNKCNVTAHFPASFNLGEIYDLVRDCFPDFPVPNTIQAIPDRDWVSHVQSSWKPIVVADKFVLRFPWHSNEDVQQVTNGMKAEDLFEMQLQGGVAFGTGEHPTTQLCLEWLDKILTTTSDSPTKKDDSPIWILDYGSGSGVLGMAACKLLPARVHSIGIDIDMDACLIANENAFINQVNMQNYLPPLSAAADDDSKALLLKARRQAQAQLLRDDIHKGTDAALFMPEVLQDQKYDVCVANILANPLVALAPTLVAMLKPGGYLGLSGILRAWGDNVAQAYLDAGMQDVQIANERHGWVLVTARRPLQ